MSNQSINVHKLAHCNVIPVPMRYASPCIFLSVSCNNNALSPCQGLPGPPGEKGENGDVGPMVSGGTSLALGSRVQPHASPPGLA